MPKPEENILDSWSRVIDQMAENSRRRDDEALETMRTALPIKIGELGGMGHTELVQVLRDKSGWGSHDPRQTIVMQEYCDAVQAEILTRLRK